MSGGTAPIDKTEIVKTMALTRAEFERSVCVLLGPDAPVDGPLVRAAVISGSVGVRFEPLPGVRLGGLLELPRAKVTLEFDGIDATRRDDFLRRFDFAFQRGGG